MAYNKILIYGTGAVGGYFGGMLYKAGKDVLFVARGARLEAYQNNGIDLINEKGEKEHLQINATDSPEGLYDLILICVKSGDTAEASFECSKFLNVNGTVVSMQNGVNNLTTMVEYFKPDQIVAGVINSGISFIKPNLISYIGTPRVCFGSYNNVNDDIAVSVNNLFTQAGIKSSTTDNIDKKMWEKLVWNIMFNPLSALMRSTCGELLDSPYSRMLMIKMGNEVLQVGLAKGIEMSKDIVEKSLLTHPLFNTYKTSALQDVEANKAPELEPIFEPVMNNNTAPTCSAVYDLCRYKFKRWFHTFPRVAADVLVVKGDNVLLIERKFPPHGWAIPGGMVDYGETVEQAAIRELFEETGIQIKEENLTLIGVYSDPKRDFRGHIVSMIYFARVNSAIPEAGDDAAEAEFFNINSLPVNLAFDHRQVLRDYINKFHKNP